MSKISRPVLLASASPRRLEILRAHGIEPEVLVAEVDEESIRAAMPSPLVPHELARELALAKAQAVHNKVSSEDALILAADTLVYKENVGVLGKPKDEDDAIGMLAALCDTSHEVITGVALIDVATGAEQSFTDITTVTFSAYDLDEIKRYLELEPPYDKAGSYAIQGYWGKHVASVDGDLENVIGLPFYRIEGLLKA